MPSYSQDDRIILTLDAGGTNFSFSAFSRAEQIVEPINLKPVKDDLDKTLDIFLEGFKEVLGKTGKADAISFAFPGPADYQSGVIFNEGNLPAFKDGVALKEFLEAELKLPTFINNDGDLFTYGEGSFGFLPYVNNLLKEAGSQKVYKNLIGVTLGTGYGGGFYYNQNMFRGDNSNGMEVWTSSGSNPLIFTEEEISKRAISRNYGDMNLDPFDIYQIAQKEKEGDQAKALKAFEVFGECLGHSLANLICFFDAPVVIGGGLARSHSLFSRSMMNVIRGKIQDVTGKSKKRIIQKAFWINEEEELFLQKTSKEIKVPRSDKTLTVELDSKIPIGKTEFGTNKMTSLGAYAYAIDRLEGVNP